MKVEQFQRLEEYNQETVPGQQDVLKDQIEIFST